MRVALCIAGQMRTYRKCYKKLKKNIIDPLKPDIFIHTWDYAGVSTKVDGSRGEKITYKTLDAFFSPKSCVIEKFKEGYHDSFRGVTVPETLKNMPRYKGNVPQFYKVYECNRLKQDYERKFSFKYDVVIRIRPDLNVLKKLPRKVLLQPNLMWTTGLTDTRFRYDDGFAVSNSGNMDYYSSVWERLNTYWENPLGNGKFVSHRVGDQLMKYHLDNSSIKMGFFYIPMHIFRIYNNKIATHI